MARDATVSNQKKILSNQKLILGNQREGSPHPLEIVLTEMPCDRDRLCKVLLRYVRQLETRTAEQRVGVHSA